MKLSETIPVISEHKNNFLREHPSAQLEADLNGLIADLLEEFGQEYDLKEFRELFGLCDYVDANFLAPMELLPEILKVRADIMNALIEKFYKTELSKLKIGQHKENALLGRKLYIAKFVARLVPRIRAANLKRFDQVWIQMNCEGFFDELRILLTDSKTGNEDWELFRSILPPDLQGKFEAIYQNTRDPKLLEDVKAFLPVAKMMGVEAVTQYLISSGKISQRQYATAVKTISQYLGKCQFTLPTLEDVLKYPEGLLRLDDVRDVIFLLLRNHVYLKGILGAARDYSSVA